METVKLALEPLGQGHEARQRGVDLLRQLGRVAGKRPGVVGALVRMCVALSREAAETEALPADLGRRPGGCCEGRQGTIGQLECHGGAVFDLDRIDARGDLGGDAPDRAEDVVEHVDEMDGVVHQVAAELCPPSAAPWHGIVVRATPPGHLHGSKIGLAGQPLLDQQLELLQAMAETILKDRHHPPARARLGRDQLVDLLDRADQRLLADRVLAGR